MSFSRLPLMVWAGIYLALGSGVAQQYSTLAGLSLILLSISMLSKERKLLPKSKELLTPLGLSSLIIFISGFIVGLSFLIGPYALGSFMVEPANAALVGIVLIMFSVVEFSKRK